MMLLPVMLRGLPLVELARAVKRSLLRWLA